MSSGGKRTPGEGKKLGAPKKRETTTKTFRFPLDKREEIVERIKAIISFYNNA
jgi:hypothetical protein